MLNFHLTDSKLTAQDRRLLVSDVNWLLDMGQWCPTAPPFQTWPNLLMTQTGPHWQRLRQSHHDALATFEPRPVRHQLCWAYKTIPWLDATQHFQDLWHTHDWPDTGEKISSILYLLLPKGASGTEYQDGDSIKVMPHEENSWCFFPSNLKHRPGYWNHMKIYQSRIIISIDSYF